MKREKLGHSVPRVRFQELEPMVMGFGGMYPLCNHTVRCSLAAIYAEQGREPEARAEFEQLAAKDSLDLPLRVTWLFSVAVLGEGCAFLRDAHRAKGLYDLTCSTIQTRSSLRVMF